MHAETIKFPLSGLNSMKNVVKWQTREPVFKPGPREYVDVLPQLNGEILQDYYIRKTEGKVQQR